MLPNDPERERLLSTLLNEQVMSAKIPKKL